MKKTLGKKAVAQDGTLAAFADCSCTADCSILGCYCTSQTTAQNTLNLQNYSKMLNVAISGKWAF